MNAVAEPSTNLLDIESLLQGLESSTLARSEGRVFRTNVQVLPQ